MDESDRHADGVTALLRACGDEDTGR